MKSATASITGAALAIASCLLVGNVNLRAQDGPPPQGNFNPSQMRERMLTRLREQLEVTDDAEWKALSERITKVMDARRSLGGLRGPGGFPGGPGGPPPDGQGGPPPGGFSAPSVDGQPNLADRPEAGGPPGFGGSPGPGGPSRTASVESQALRQALDSKAAVSELKSKMQSLRDARKQKQEELEKAQDELRQLLSVRQEAVATMAGLL